MSKLSQDETPASTPIELEWLEQAGAYFPKLVIGYLEGGERGVLARADIAPGEEVLRVPRRCLLTPELARSSDIGRLIAAHVPSASENVYLAAFLLQERERKDSVWRPYLDTLPDAFPHSPLFYSKQELSLLRGSSFLEVFSGRKALLLSEYARLCRCVPGFVRFSLEAFLWARLVVNSRGFGVKREGHLVQCLVPLADMLNHRRGPEVRWGLSEDGECFVMVARESVPAGAQLHSSYGAKSSIRFLLNYGFVPEDNPEDELVLHLGIPDEDPDAATKRELLGLSAAPFQRRFEVPLQYDDTSTGALLSFLRVACAQGEELVRLTEAAGSGGLVGGVGPLGVANEERVLGTFAALCEARLAGFETTLEEDERLLQETGLSRNARNCLLLRRGEKRMLHQHAEQMRSLLSLLRQVSSETGG